MATGSLFSLASPDAKKMCGFDDLIALSTCLQVDGTCRWAVQHGPSSGCSVVGTTGQWDLPLALDTNVLVCTNAGLVGSTGDKDITTGEGMLGACKFGAREEGTLWGAGMIEEGDEIGAVSL